MSEKNLQVFPIFAHTVFLKLGNCWKFYISLELNYGWSFQTEKKALLPYGSHHFS